MKILALGMTACQAGLGFRETTNTVDFIMNKHPLHYSRFYREPIVKGYVMTSAGSRIPAVSLEPFHDNALLRLLGWGYYLPVGDMSVYGGVQTDVYWMDTETYRVINHRVYYDDTKLVIEPEPFQKIPEITVKMKNTAREILRCLDNRTLKFCHARRQVGELLGITFGFKECCSLSELRELVTDVFNLGVKR